MKLRATLLFLLAGFVLATTPVWSQSICDDIAGNLVVNCGFETGDFTGWTQDGNTGFTGVTTFPQLGNYAAYLGPVAAVMREPGAGWSVITAPPTKSCSGCMSDGGTPNDFELYWNGIEFWVRTGRCRRISGITKSTFDVAGSPVPDFDLLGFSLFRSDSPLTRTSMT